MRKSNYELVKIIEDGSAKTFVYRPKDNAMQDDYKVFSLPHLYFWVAMMFFVWHIVSDKLLVFPAAMSYPMDLCYRYHKKKGLTPP